MFKKMLDIVSSNRFKKDLKLLSKEDIISSFLIKL